MTALAPTDLLAAERAELRDRIEAMREELKAMQQSRVDSNSDDEHDPEGSTVAFERAQVESLLDNATEHLAEIDAAAERHAAGRYGICERCEGRIAVPRLKALPSTRYCIDCAAHLERTA